MWFLVRELPSQTKDGCLLVTSSHGLPLVNADAGTGREWERDRDRDRERGNAPVSLIRTLILAEWGLTLSSS